MANEVVIVIKVKEVSITALAIPSSALPDRYKSCPPNCYPKPAINDPLFQDKQYDKDKESEVKKDQDAVEPIRLLKCCDKLFGGGHSSVQSVALQGC